jgi:hypothetical protein
MSQNSYTKFLIKNLKNYLEKKTLIGSSTWGLSKPFGGLGILNHDGRPLEMVSFVVHFPWCLDAPQKESCEMGGATQKYLINKVLRHNNICHLFFRTIATKVQFFFLFFFCFLL